MLNSRSNGYDADVLIVGAGPIGLILAALLRQKGVKAEIIDEARSKARLSKGLTNNPAALEVFSQIPGLLTAHLGAGFPIRMVNVRRGDRLIAKFSLSQIASDVNLFNIVPQWKTEELLEKVLLRNGVKVNR